jgi:two-component system, NarL family, sensor histidine kinase DesK
VIRHSGASNCQVHLLARSGELSLEISDNGHGLESIPRDPVSGDPVPMPVTSPPSATPAAWAGENGGAAGHAVPGAGSGLRGMSERLTAIGGQLSISHAKVGRDRRGLRLVATMPEAPVRPAAEDAAPGKASSGNGRPAATAARVGAAVPPQ